MRSAALSIIALRFREMLQYRAAAWAGVFTQVIFGFILLMVLLAFYASSDRDSPMNREQLTVYIWLGQMFFTLMPWGADRSVTAMIRTGSVAYELARPMDVYLLWFCRTMGWRLCTVLARGLPLLLIVGLLFPAAGLGEWALPAPASLASLAAFFVAMLAAVFLGVTLTMLMHVVILWTLDPEGIVRIAPAFVMLLAGSIVPLPLFPDALQALLAALPFRGLLDVPLRLYSGHIPAADAHWHILLTATWTAVLIVAGRLIMKQGLKQIVVQGG